MGAQDLNQRALEQFRKVVRFILVRSGESVEAFLAGRFNDILHTVLRENLGDELDAAASQRDRYQRDLASSLFSPLSTLASREIRQMMPEIERVAIEPRVLGLDETFANPGIVLLDGAATGLAQKGTGVRGSLLLAMLRYIAESSRRSVVFAVEEPEAFLHPAAQEEVRDDLEAIAERDDVTLLVTSHSPFVVSRSPKARMISLSKDSNGRTQVLMSCAGDEDARPVLGALFNDRLMPDYLEQAAQTRDDVRAFLVVEGFTDAAYLRLAAERGGGEGFAAGIEIVPADGARSAAVQGVLFRAAHDCPVIVLLDFEPLTKGYREMLKDTFTFRPEELMTYRDIVPDNVVEAEALFPSSFLVRFVREAGEDTVVSEKVKTTNGWRYGFNQSGKAAFLEFIDRKARKADLAKFVEVWRAVDERVGKLEERRARAAAAVRQ